MKLGSFPFLSSLSIEKKKSLNHAVPLPFLEIVLDSNPNFIFGSITFPRKFSILVTV